MLPGRVAPPVPDERPRPQLPVDWASISQSIVIEAPIGALAVRRLAADLQTIGDVQWVRLAPFELDGANVDVAPLSKAIRLAAESPTHPVLVAEGAVSDERVVRRLASAAAATGRHLIVVSEGGQALARSEGARLVAIHPLSFRQVRQLPGAEDLGRHAARRIGSLARGRAAIVEAIVRTTISLGPRRLTRSIDGAADLHSLLVRLASEILGALSPAQWSELELATLVGYVHESLPSLATVLDRVAHDPWWVPLADGWSQLDPAWQAAIAEVVGRHRPEQGDGLGRLLSDLVAMDATEEAIELCLDAGRPALARDLLASVAETMVADGRHRSLSRWLQRLPSDTMAPLESSSRPWPPLCAAERDTAELGRTPVEPSAPAPAEPEQAATPSGVPSADPVAAVALVPSTLTCRALGTFEVAVNGVAATSWKGNRGRMLIAYLLLHRSQPVGCEMLAGVFWPEASPSQARNRLHVTLHGLRRDLRTVTDQPVLVYARGYRLNPELRVEIDLEVFDELVAEARQAEADGDADRAMKAYEAAMVLSGGDLLEDAPYEEWTVLPREQHRVARLRALDRLADLQFQAGDYDACIETCQRLLATDYCREDVHRLLMRCYSRLNQAHLALRQYKSCCRQLRAELQLEPDRETCQLHDQIRRRVLV